MSILLFRSRAFSERDLYFLKELIVDVEGKNAQKSSKIEFTYAMKILVRNKKPFQNRESNDDRTTCSGRRRGETCD